jgi:hypothetical protein
MYKNFFISHPFQKGGYVLGVFRSNGQTAGPIFMKFGINVLGTETYLVQRGSDVFLRILKFISRFKMAAGFRGFPNYRQTPDQIS